MSIKNKRVLFRKIKAEIPVQTREIIEYMSHKQNGRTFPALPVGELRPGQRIYSAESLVKFAAVALVLLLATGVRGQDTGKLAEPGAPSVLFKLDLSGRLVPLESQVVHVKHKFHAWGFSGVTMVYQVEGEKSRVRLKAEGKPEFVVRLEGKLDPLETVQFYHFDKIDGSRAVPIGDFDALGRMSDFQLVHATVDFNAVKYGASSFRLIPVPALVPGEYCLVVRVATKPENKSPGFCFGIDAAGN